MKNRAVLITACSLLVSLSLHVPFAAGADEIVITVTASPSEAGPSLLTREAVELAKSKARDAYREAKAKGIEQPIVVEFPPGLLKLEAPIVLGPEDSGDEKRPIIWRGIRKRSTRLSGGIFLSDWTTIAPGVVQTTLPDVAAGKLHFRTVWIESPSSKPVRRCRLPKKGYFRIEKSGEDRRTNFTWQGDDLMPYKDLKNVELVFLHDWSITRCPVESIDPATKTLRVPRQIGSGLKFFMIDHWEPQPRYFLENSIEFLTEPGEWHLDHKTGKLTYRLRPGESADSLVLIAPRLESLLVLEGTPEKPISHVHFEDIDFAHASVKPETEDTYWGIQATWHHQPNPNGEGVVSVAPLTAAVRATNAQYCKFTGIWIWEVSATGLSLGQGTLGCTVRNCWIDSCGGNGIIVGSVKQENPARKNRIDECCVFRAGEVFYGAVGIWIGFAQETTVSSSCIGEMPYTGVSVGWMWNPTPTVSRANRIIDNEIGSCMQILSDGGGIYTLGFQPDSLLAGNHIHHIPLNAGRAESNGMFLDEGTKGFTIENNFIHDTDKSPLRFHRCETNVVKNNYLIVPNEQTPMIRYNATPVENLTTIDNITKVENLEEALRQWLEKTTAASD